MFNNLGTIDRLIRLILGSVLAYFGLLVYSGSALGISLTIGAVVLVISALAGSCLLYGLFGINTRKQGEIKG
ncbi:DUF2892 domain-containing protein [Pleurocapsales cyanobacterium LEGE 06147]|nr:DUF2892 domain-containing protein [Pleurocapsales cyanobacterium LEGE 06147]